MKKTIYIFILLVTLNSCEKEIGIPDSELEKYVVVNSIISTDSTWVVKLHYSKSIFDRGDFQPVDNARIHIRVNDDVGENGERIQDFFLNDTGNGVYTRGNNPVEGRNYKMSIEVDDFELCAETYVPKVLEAEISATSSTLDADNNTISYSIAIDVKQDNPVDNYFAWELIPIEVEEAEIDRLTETFSSQGTGLQNDEYDVTSDGPDDGIGIIEVLEVDDEGISTGENNGTSLRDPIVGFLGNSSGIKAANPNFDNGEGQIIANVSTGLTNDQKEKLVLAAANSSTLDTPKQKYKLKVWAVSVDYYRYLLSIENNDLPTSESSYINSYSNIQNGGGIFAGYNLKEFEVEL